MAEIVPVTNHENRQGSSVTTSTRMRDHYDIEYARFFSYPRDGALFGTSFSPLLKPLSKSMKRRQGGGTWLSSSTASLDLYADLTVESLPEVILVISVREKIHEEHFISKLHFSWPQISCVSQFPGRGSRVVFASYKDCTGQIQKFAMRFQNSSESQTLINSLKENLKDVNVGISSNNLGLENYIENEFITENKVHHRANEELSNVHPVGNYTPPMQSSLNLDVQNTCSEQTPLGHDFGGTCAPLPPSFTALLANGCIDAQQAPSLVPEKVDPKTQIAGYMSASSFQDMLSKLENLINDMGGDLALELS